MVANFNAWAGRGVIRVLLPVLGLLVGLNAAAAGLDAQIDRTRVAEGETVVLTLTAPGNADGSPDPAPLQRDFDILNRSQSTRMSIVNGRSSTSKEWRWVLSPKRAGELTVPALELDGSASQPLALQVLPAAEAAKQGTPRPVMVEVEAQPEQPYVQGQVIYTVRVLSRVPLRQAGLSELQAGDALVERLGQDKHYNVYRDGQQYEVIERRYAIFPQRRGQLEIAAPVLTAQISEPGGRGNMRERLFGRDPFADMESIFGSDPFADMDSMFDRIRPVQVRGQSLSLQVQAPPAGAASLWLPAASLTLTDDWSPDPPELRVGEPVTRTLTISADGLTDAQLPDLKPPLPSGVKVYPDKAQGETQSQGDGVSARKVLKSALVPTQAGELTLPEVRLPWWDVKTNKPRVATLPARTFKVLPAIGGASPASPVDAEQPSAAPAKSEASSVTEPEIAVDGPGAEATEGRPEVGGTALARLGNSVIRKSGIPAGYWPWITGILALAWLASIAFWLRSRGMATAGAARLGAAARSEVKLSAARARVKSACNAGDARAARQALLDWAGARWPSDPPRSLDALAQRLGDAAPVLRELDRHLYAQAEQAWDGAAAWKRLAPHLDKGARGSVSDRDGSPLPSLYPHQA